MNIQHHRHQRPEVQSYLYLTWNKEGLKTSLRFQTFEEAQRLARLTVTAHAAQNLHCRCAVRPSLKPAQIKQLA